MKAKEKERSTEDIRRAEQQEERSSSRFLQAVEEILTNYAVITAGPNIGYLLINEYEEGKEIINIVEKQRARLRWGSYCARFAGSPKEVNPLDFACKSPAMKEVKGVKFVPGAEAPEGYANWWKKWPHLPVAGSCEKFLNHIKYIIAGGKEENYEYIMNWCALLVQKPTVRCEVALALRGQQGAGKGKFARNIGALVAPHYHYGTTIQAITGNFNSQLEGKVYAFLDEVNSKVDQNDESKLRSYITEPTIEINPKHRNPVTYDNYLHFILAGNSENFLRLTRDDRRFAVFYVSDERLGTEYPEYYQEIDDELVSGGYEALMYFLLTRDISKFNPRIFPTTHERASQKMHAANSAEKWWMDFVSIGDMPASILDISANNGKMWKDSMIQVPVDTLHSYYVNYVREMRTWGRTLDRIELERQVAEMTGIERGPYGYASRMRVMDSRNPVRSLKIPDRGECVRQLALYFKIEVEQLGMDDIEE